MSGESIRGRKLKGCDDVWDFNAWDDVEWDDEYLRTAQSIVDGQNSHVVPQYELSKAIYSSSRYWDVFYKHNKTNFFKDRNWIHEEFAFMLKSVNDDDVIEILEVGCGVGNSVFPLLQMCKNRARVYCCDFSKNSINLLKSDHRFSPECCFPFIWDLTNVEENIPVKRDSLDYIIMTFVLSAINPYMYSAVIGNLTQYLKPGGTILFRDYAKYDLVQLRFKPVSHLSNGLYRRGDGTLVYFFEKEEADGLFSNAGLELVSSFIDRRLLTNRARQLKMYRSWLQGIYRKPL